MTYAIEMAGAQTDILRKEREAYAKEGEAEFWDGAFRDALKHLLASPGEATLCAAAACLGRRHARMQRWDEDHGTGWSDLAEGGASKEDIEAAITAATGRPADLSKGE